ncbi:MAG: hypothetical protein R3C39_12180 [Dehalococcoidia bacterium]
MPDGLSPAEIERRIRAYEGFGIYRTGWPGDDRSAEWMRDELAAAGIEASLERFPFPRVELRRARLDLGGGHVIEGVPLYDGGFTPAGGIDGALVPPDASDLFGAIVVANDNDPDFALPRIAEQVERLEAEGVIGLVLVKSDPKGAITVINAERIEHPFALPVLQVGRSDARELASAMIMNGEGVLEIDGERLRSRALNVVATLPGADPEAAPIGVMTPRSGWFTCASERGGGIAILLGLAEALAGRDRKRTIELVASSGHELHHQGLQAYLEARRGIEASAHAWLHLGANIGTSTGPVRVESNEDGLRTLAETSMREAGVERFEVITQKGGEARNIDEAGGRYISFRGGNDYFHSPNDTFDVACDADLASGSGRAALAIVERWLDE